MVLIARPALPGMWLQPITYRGRVMACTTATRLFLADELERRPPADPELNFVLFMCSCARDILTVALPGPYRDEDARTYARAALIPEELLERPLPDARRTANALGVPLEELLGARQDHRPQQAASR